MSMSMRVSSIVFYYIGIPVECVLIACLLAALAWLRSTRR